MNLGKGIIWAAIVFISAGIATALHIPSEATLPWGMMTAPVAYLIVRRVDLSQSRFLGALLMMEKYRLPTLIVFLPLSLILFALNTGEETFSPAFFWTGLISALVTIAIMISYTINPKKQ